MLSSRYRCPVVLGLAGLSLSSCEMHPTGEDSKFRVLPPITWQGRFLEFGTDVDVDICPAMLPSLDEYIRGVDEYVRSNTSLPVRYYYLRNDLTSYGFDCPEGSLGCADRENGNAVVGSRLLSLRHEIIHASASLSPYPHRVLDEGLAVFLGTDLQRLGMAEPSEIRDAFASVDGSLDVLSAEHYPVAGHFVSFLVDKYGLAGTVEFVDATEAGMTLDDLAELSIAHFGQVFQLELEEYEALGAGCEATRFASTWFECDFLPPSIPLFACDAMNEPEPIELALSCAEGALGVQDGTIWRDIIIDVPGPALTVIYLYEGHPVEFVVRSCGHGCSMSHARVSSETVEAGPILPALELAAGMNLIRVIKPVEAAGPVRFSIGMQCF